MPEQPATDAPRPPTTPLVGQRRRVKEREAMAADVIVETPDTVTLVLCTGSERLDYEAGTS